MEYGKELNSILYSKIPRDSVGAETTKDRIVKIYAHSLSSLFFCKDRKTFILGKLGKIG